MIAKNKWIEFRCTVCFNAVRKFVLIEDGTYPKIDMMCQGQITHHVPAQMCEVLNHSKGVPNA